MRLDERLKKIKLIIMDVDGVLTDGSIYLDEQGHELKRFNVKDGSGIKFAHRSGLKTALISGRSSPVVDRRAIELGISEVIQLAKQKLPPYEALLKKYNLKDEEAAYIGDDVLDLGILRRVGFAVSVADAHEEVKKTAHYVTAAPGGQGAVREMIEMILTAQDKWDKIMERYR